MAGLIYKELWHSKKIRRWTDAQLRLWIMAISFTEDNGTKGYLDEDELITLAAFHRVPQAVIAELATTDVRGLDLLPDGRYRIHNYAKRGKLSRVRSAAGKKGYSAMVENLPGNPARQKVGELSPANSGVEVGVEERIFRKWCEPLGRKVRFTDGRRRVVRARLRDGYPEEDLLDAAIGWQNDTWPDRVHHNDLTILFRNGEQVEKFRDLQRNPPVKLPTVNSRMGRAIKAGRDWQAIADDLEAAGVEQ